MGTPDLRNNLTMVVKMFKDFIRKIREIDMKKEMEITLPLRMVLAGASFGFFISGFFVFNLILMIIGIVLATATFIWTQRINCRNVRRG